MPQLTIDGRKIEVESGVKVIEAAERLGIMIPRFCYHPALGAVGACRMCAVMFLDGPVKGLEMSCMIEAKDGMTVSTDHPDAMKFRAQVVEWLMMNHPHDCPVCDEGGHCLLQDMTVSGGHSIRRYKGPKRTHNDQYLGPLVQHEMNRCIQCYRCVRFYQDYAGYRDLGVMGNAGRVYYGRFEDGVLESPFSGNLIDICPTGVYTDKPSRFKARRWDLERADSICLHCSLGCNITAGARYRGVIRLEARINEKVNGHFICDRGRYGYEYANLENRPRQARIDGRDIAPDAAVRTMAACLKTVAALHGPEAVAAIGSPRSSLETMSALARLCRVQGWRTPEFFLECRDKSAARSALAGLEPDLAVSLADIGEADCILAVGVDPINEAPMLALAMRQAVRQGAEVVVIDPRPVRLPFSFRHVPAGRSDLDACLSALIRLSVDRPDDSISPETGAMNWGEWWDALPAVFPKGIEPLQCPGLIQSKNPIIVVGSEVAPESSFRLARACARFLKAARGRAGLFITLCGPNAFGAALLDSDATGTFEDIVEGAISGRIKGLLIVEGDPLGRYPDREKIEQAFKNLEFLGVMDYLPSRTTGQAQVFLPTQTVFEAGGRFVNNEGRLQYAHPVHAVGQPIEQVSGGGHPPRSFTAVVPGGDPKPAWELLTDLTREMSAAPDLVETEPWRILVSECSALADLPLTFAPSEGVRVLQPEPAARGTASAPVSSHPSEEGFDVLFGDRTFGTEELSGYGPTPAEMSGEPAVFLHEEDAESFGLADGDRIALPSEKGADAAVFRTSRNMARKTIIAPRKANLLAVLHPRNKNFDGRPGREVES